MLDAAVAELVDARDSKFRSCIRSESSILSRGTKHSISHKTALDSVSLFRQNFMSITDVLLKLPVAVCS